MAAYTGKRQMLAGQRKGRCIVVESCRRPAGGIVAGLTFRGEAVSHMIWFGGGIIVTLVTGETGARCSGISRSVTGEAIDSEMFPG